MATLTLIVPDSLAVDEKETRLFIAAKLFESGKVTLGQAADVAGMKKWDFAEVLIQYNVNYLDASVVEDLKSIRLHEGK